jgi:hypothetical protein
MEGPIWSIFVFVELIIFLKTYLVGGLAPPNQLLGFLLFPPAGNAGWENDMSMATKDSTRTCHFIHLPSKETKLTKLKYQFLGFCIVGRSILGQMVNPQKVNLP